jgi:4-alpha-glucanotransferase
MDYDYSQFLSTPTKKQWERIGLKRRAGVAVPLFSLYSLSSIGIGELRDLKLMIDWCKSCGMSIIQLLPLNDVGFNFMPYDAQSCFALEPMYLAVESLWGVTLKSLESFGGEIKKLRKGFPLEGRRRRVNYKIKQAKLDLLWKIFKDNQEFPEDFKEYARENKFWLDDFAFFKVIKEKNKEAGWEFWDTALKQRKPSALKAFEEKNTDRITFHKWLQWQLYEQVKMVKNYAESKDVLLMGDLPFLVSRDSADVWSRQNYFKLDLASGAPADMYFAQGQRWGMPVYNWENIAKNNYDYIKEKLKYAENFYDLFRIDHAVGMFRIWTISMDEPLEHGGLRGKFDPLDENVWEAHGRRSLSVFIAGTTMLPCAEDLGVIPHCSFKVLEEYGIPGTDVQRWMKDWGRTYNFKAPEDYRKNSIASISTHDSSTLCNWWDYEAGTVDEKLFKRKCKENDIDFDSVKDKIFDLENSFHGRLRWRQQINSTNALLKILHCCKTREGDIINIYRESYNERKKFSKFLGFANEPKDKCPHELIRAAMEKVSNAASIFSIQLLLDWLSIDCMCKCDDWHYRINFPGTISDKNWSLVMDLSLEEILDLPINNVIRNINMKAGRS